MNAQRHGLLGKLITGVLTAHNRRTDRRVATFLGSHVPEKSKRETR